METIKEEMVADFVATMARLAREEGIEFERQNGRKPTDQEADRLAENLLRQAKLAVAMVR